MVSGWAQPLVAVAVLWVIVAAAWAPLLRFDRIRGPLDGWPSARLAVNYLGLTGIVVVGQAAVFLSRVVVAGTLGGVELVRWTLTVAVGYPVALWLLVVAVTVTTGQWDSAGERRRHWLAFAIGAIWYAIVVAVAAAVVFFGLFVLFFPG